MRRGFIILALLAVACGAKCCDDRHDGFVKAEANTKICADRGGVPVTEPIQDAGMHTFNILKQCAFPGNQQLAVEKP